MLVFAGEQRISQLDLSAWGTDIDIPEQLAMDTYVARHFRPYICTAMALESVVFGLFWVMLRCGRLGIFAKVVGILWMVSVTWHGWKWLLTAFFTAGERF